ncbi:MAG: trypsin-like peptidase domain-containing protein [Bacillaceae bacterium]|nr:trypsin-like peptidase domain-containing protein [Bacillaceae bacterium]
MRKKFTYFHPKKRKSQPHAAYNMFVPVVEQVKNSIVSIETQDKSRSKDMHDIFQFLFPEYDSSPPTRGFGSGFVIHPAGYILTSQHVIHKARQIYARLSNGAVKEAETVWEDQSHDIAVLRLKTRKTLPPLPLGSSSQARVGEWVISIGNPLGLDHSVTVGVISAKNRPVRISNKTYDDVIQTDAAINPGNSGGPLINMNGEAIGMNAFIIKSNQGLGFAIGIDSIKSRIRRFLP